MSKTVQWILGILVSIGISVSGYSLTRIDKQQEATAQNYLQKQEYYKDQGMLCDQLNRIENKIDKNHENSIAQAKELAQELHKHELSTKSLNKSLRDLK
jgi:mannose-1-phosphate guanylyltransferase